MDATTTTVRRAVAEYGTRTDPTSSATGTAGGRRCRAGVRRRGAPTPGVGPAEAGRWPRSRPGHHPRPRLRRSTHRGTEPTLGKALNAAEHPGTRLCSLCGAAVELDPGPGLAFSKSSRGSNASKGVGNLPSAPVVAGAVGDLVQFAYGLFRRLGRDSTGAQRAALDNLFEAPGRRTVAGNKSVTKRMCVRPGRAVDQEPSPRCASTGPERSCM